MNNHSLAGKRILAVEDNSINQMLVRHTLTKMGATVDVANHGVHALEFLKGYSYDAILMDLYMPELDGYQTTKIIRNELKLSLPIVAMTALSIKGELENCISLGMNGYISKPFTTEILCNELLKALHKTVAPKHSLPLFLSDGGIHIDLSFLNNLAGNDVVYIISMIELFIKETPDKLFHIHQTFHQQNQTLFLKYLHNLKSSLSVVKVKEMYDLTLEIETNIKETDSLPTSVGLLNLLNHQFAKAENLLQKQLQDLASIKQVA